MNLIDNPHYGLENPIADSDSVCLIRGRLKYFHYVCDGFNDKGWGCGYRTLQSVLSWIQENQKTSQMSDGHFSLIPSILDIQKALVDMGDKNQSFIESREWIGSVEVAYCIEYFYKVQSRIIHARDVNELKNHVDEIAYHFKKFGSPIMMGGDRDCSSKCILGICISCMCPDDAELLILDPHYSGHTTSREHLQTQGWIKWQKIDSFDHSSFYNFCCPQIKARE